MSDQLFPENVSKATQDRIKELASKVYNKNIEDLTKQQVQTVVGMDLGTFPSKLSVSAAATRPTDVKYATNNYHTSMEIDLSGMSKFIQDSLDHVEDPGAMLEHYLETKSAAFSLIKIKYEGTENYLRDLLDTAMSKDNCPKVGRYN